MLTIASVDMSGFNAGMRGLARIGIPMAKIVKKETGELIKTLVKISQPPNKERTKRKIADRVLGRFEKVSDGSLSAAATPGKTGIIWYFFDEAFARGVAAKSDKRNASVGELQKIYYTINKEGRQILPFRPPRKHQRVMLKQTILTRNATVKKLSAKLQKHVGRRAAAWLKAVNDNIIQISGRNMPPRWVTDHVNGARGNYQNGLSSDKSPSFTLTNFAKGIRAKGFNFLIKSALAIRAKAMQDNAKLYFKGKKNLADYASA